MRVIALGQNEENARVAVIVVRAGRAGEKPEHGASNSIARRERGLNREIVHNLVQLVAVDHDAVARELLEQERLACDRRAQR